MTFDIKPESPCKSETAVVENLDIESGTEKDENNRVKEVEDVTDEDGDEENSVSNCFFNARRYRGMLFALASSFTYSLTALIVKNWEEDHNPVKYALWRFQGALWPSLFLLAYRLAQERDLRKQLETDKKMSDGLDETKSVLHLVYPFTKGRNIKYFCLTLVRSALTCNAVLLHFYSLQRISLGDAQVLTSSTPIFVTLFAHLFLGESCGIVPVLTTVGGVVGVVAVAHPQIFLSDEEFNYSKMLGTSFALGCLLLSTMSYLLLRYIRKVHHIVTTLCFGGWGALECMILAVVLGLSSWPENVKDWAIAVTLASLTFVGQLAIILAMKYEKAGPVALVRTFDVVFAFFWQICIFNCWPNLTSWIGCSIIMVSLIVTALRKWIEALDKNDVYRRRLSFLLL